MEKPPIVWIGAHPTNYYQGREAIEFEAIVIHTTAGGSAIESLDSWFNTPVGVNGKTPGSTNYGVGRDGRIHAYVEVGKDTPIANGANSSATAAIVAENPGVSANAYTISIEHLDAGTPGSVTDAQLEASAQLSAWLFQEVLFKSGAQPTPTVSRRCVLQHYEFDAINRTFCASWSEDRMARYINRITQILAPAPIPPEPTPEPPPVTDYAALYLAELYGELAGAEDDATRAAVRIATISAKLAAEGITV